MDDLKENNEKKLKQIPRFFFEHLEALSELRRFIDLARAGMDYGLAGQKVLETIKKHAHYLPDGSDYTDETKYGAMVAKMGELEEFAKRQESRGYPYLYGIAVVRLWTILESLVDDLVVWLLDNMEEEKVPEEVQQLKGRLVEFLKAGPDEQTHYLYERLEEKLRATYRAGVERFESVLGVFKFGGAIDDLVRRRLFELSQIRHVIVHRNGKVDRRLRERCPGIEASVGEVLEVGPKDFASYSGAALYYTAELAKRWVQPMIEETEESKEDAARFESLKGIALESLEKLR